MWNGGEVSDGLAEIVELAQNAHYHRMPFYAYLMHLRKVRRRYGAEAECFEVEHSAALRELELRTKIEAAEKAKRS